MNGDNGDSLGGGTVRQLPASLATTAQMLCYVMLCYVMLCIFFVRGPSAPKVPYWGTGRAELEKLEPIYTLITEYYEIQFCRRVDRHNSSNW
jgi:hypothetical protein